MSIQTWDRCCSWQLSDHIFSNDNHHQEYHPHFWSGRRTSAGLLFYCSSSLHHLSSYHCCCCRCRRRRRRRLFRLRLILEKRFDQLLGNAHLSLSGRREGWSSQYLEGFVELVVAAAVVVVGAILRRREMRVWKGKKRVEILGYVGILLVVVRLFLLHLHLHPLGSSPLRRTT